MKHELCLLGFLEPAVVEYYLLVELELLHLHRQLVLNEIIL
jgi:hypothetical protein